MKIRVYIYRSVECQMCAVVMSTFDQQDDGDCGGDNAPVMTTQREYCSFFLISELYKCLVMSKSHQAGPLVESGRVVSINSTTRTRPDSVCDATRPDQLHGHSVYSTCRD